LEIDLGANQIFVHMDTMVSGAKKYNNYH